jgi:hypothetical protein
MEVDIVEFGEARAAVELGSYFMRAWLGKQGVNKHG